MQPTNASINLLSLLPGYLAGYCYFTSYVDGHYPSMRAFWQSNPTALSALSLAIATPIAMAVLVYYWSIDNWSRHPFVSKFLPFASDGQWRQVAGDINTEFRRIDKFTIRTSPIAKVVVTDNWVVLVGQWPWQFELAHQSDVTTTLVASDHHHISTEGHLGGTQYLTVKVNNGRPNADSFVFRCI